MIIAGEISLDEFAKLLEKESEQSEATTVAMDQTAPAESAKEQHPCKKPRRRRRLPKHLKGLMGEANLRFARGDHEEAIKMCMEIVRSGKIHLSARNLFNFWHLSIKWFYVSTVKWDKNFKNSASLV